MSKKPITHIRFVAEYEDGRTAEFTTDRWTLKGGDRVARLIAGERQREGNLPAGKIKEVRRSPFHHQPGYRGKN